MSVRETYRGVHPLHEQGRIDKGARLRTEFAENLIRFFVKFKLRSDQIGEVAQGLRCIENLKIVLEAFNKPTDGQQCSGKGQNTFFMTPTASSVWATKSSSFCSTSCLTSSLMLTISSSVFMPLPAPVLPFAFVASRLSLEFSTPFLARDANIRFVFSVVLQPAKNLDWICASCAKRAVDEIVISNSNVRKTLRCKIRLSGTIIRDVCGDERK